MRSMSFGRLLIFGAAAFGAAAFGGACGSSTITRSGLQITTETKTRQLRQGGVHAPVLIRNPTDQPILLTTCANVVTTLVEVEVDGRWEEHSLGPGCVNIPLKPHSLGPGEQVPASGHAHQIGRFRVRARLYVDGEKLRFSRETSPAFEVF